MQRENVYIVLEYGVPSVTAELKPFHPNRLAAMNSTWQYCSAFDAASRYEPRPSKTPSFTPFQKFLAHTFYNPQTDIRVDWHATGTFSLPDILKEVEKGLEKDDDIIQQWFDADDVMKLLQSATTFPEMIDCVECICGGFEGNDRLLKIVHKILGPDAA